MTDDNRETPRERDQRVARRVERGPYAPGTRVALPPAQRPNPAPAVPDRELVRDAVASVRPPARERAPASQAPTSAGSDFEIGIKVRNTDRWAKLITALAAAGVIGSGGAGAVVGRSMAVKDLEPRLAAIESAAAAEASARVQGDAKSLGRDADIRAALRAQRCRENVLGHASKRLGYDPGWPLTDVRWKSARVEDPRKRGPLWEPEDDDECDKLPPLDDPKP